MKYTEKTYERGFSLLELLLVVGVGALLLLGGLGVYRLVTQGNKANEAIRLLTTLKNQTQLVFQNQATYTGSGTGDMIPTLITTGAIPSQYASGTSAAVDPWGRPLAVDVTGSGSQFAITMSDMTAENCVALGGVFNPANDSDFDGLEINASAATGYDIASLTSDCAGDANNEYDLTWTFY